MVVRTPELRYGELDRDRVVAGARELAERVSLDAITMRGLAAHLGISPAAMYYHVRDRDELLDMTTESVLSQIATPSDDVSWDAQLRALFTDARQAMLPVKGIAAVLQSRPVAPSGRRLNEVATAILRTAGFNATASRAGTMALSTFLLGAVALEQAIAADLAANEPAARPPLLFRAKDFTAGLDLIIGGLLFQKTGNQPA